MALLMFLVAHQASANPMDDFLRARTPLHGAEMLAWCSAQFEFVAEDSRSRGETLTAERFEDLARGWLTAGSFWLTVNKMTSGKPPKHPSGIFPSYEKMLEDWKHTEFLRLHSLIETGKEDGLVRAISQVAANIKRCDKQSKIQEQLIDEFRQLTDSLD
jgi:hypothetical protein